jgi:translation initiation factor IF-3
MFRGKQLRLISNENEQLGIVTFEEALSRAEADGLDLVMIAPTGVPPVCRIMNYGKFMYEQAKHEKDARKKQHAQKVKEVKFRPNVDDHDLETKLRHAIEFLEKGNKVKLTLYYRGREAAHQDIGEAVLKQALATIEPYAHLDGSPQRADRMVQVMLSPKVKK